MIENSLLFAFPFLFGFGIMLLDRALPPALLSLIIVASEAAAFPRYDSSLLERRAPASYTPPRNEGRFLYDIVGVVGGYVLTVLIWGVLLLTFGRRMRRRALEPPRALELETQNTRHIKPGARTAPLNSPPLSARSATSWLRKFKKSDSPVTSPVSPTSFDQKVIDEHNARAQDDLERLYAAVMDHDAKKNGSNISVDEIPKDRRRPSAISTTRSQHQHRTSTNDTDTPISPIKAIYPPNYITPAPIPPPTSPRSLASTHSKSTRFNLKNLRISSPIQKYPGVQSDDEAHTPLTPGFNTNIPSTTNSPTYEDLDRPQPLPRPAPQRGSARSPTTNTLPLRSFATPLQSPGIQTTILDRRNERLGIQTPATGVPFTPYSPYMPFTPITPVTPHLVGRKERKRAEKAEKRGVGMGRLEEEVQSPKEIWGDAY